LHNERAESRGIDLLTSPVFTKPGFLRHVIALSQFLLLCNQNNNLAFEVELNKLIFSQIPQHVSFQQ